MKFLKVKCKGCFNSFRQPEFHTYHKTLALPPKTTIAGMLGSALGISPEKVNRNWLVNNRLKIGIVGESLGKANDLWNIRKFKADQISKYKKGQVDTPYYTDVVVRELLFRSTFFLYFNFENTDDYSLIAKALQNPSWAISLGREDELIKILELKILELPEERNLKFCNTILPFDANEEQYSIDQSFLESSIGGNLLNLKPVILKLPIAFKYDEDHARKPIDYKIYTYVGNLPITPNINHKGWFDNEDKIAFQII